MYPQDTRLRSMTWIKYHAGLNLLPRLPWEQGILDREPLTEGTTILPDAVDAAKAVRALRAKTSTKTAMGGMIGWTESQDEEMAAYDDSWILDQLQLEAFGKRGGEQIIDAKLLPCLPGVDGRQWTLPGAIKMVEELDSNALYALGGPVIERRVESLLQLLRDMQRGAEEIEQDMDDSVFLHHANKD